MPLPARSTFRNWIQSLNKEWSDYIQYGENFVLKKGDSIPANTDAVYYLSHGLIKIYYKNNDKETFICITTAGNLFNEVPFFVPHKSFVSFMALTDCNITRFNKETVDKLVIKDIDLLYGIIRSTAYKTALLAITREERAKKSDLKKNICRLIIDIAAHHKFKNTFSPEITQLDIANIFNVHRSRVNQILNELNKEEVIGKFTKKQLSILSYETLLELADLD